MTVVVARRVLFFFLFLLLPLPLLSGPLAVLPAARQFYLFFAGAGSWLLLLQATACLGVCVLLAYAYGRVAGSWPARLRGSAVGLLALAMLIVFSTVPVYRPLYPAGQGWVEFRDVYKRNLDFGE